MTVAGDSVYMATSGGLLVVGDPSLSGRQYDNLDGLGTNDVGDVCVDSEGVIWVAVRGRLVRMNEGVTTGYLFQDDQGEPIPLNRVVDDSDFLWIGTDAGLVLFSKTIDDGQIQDSYGRFGDLSDFPAVHDIWLDGDNIWLATSSGLAVADRRQPRQLKVRANWTTFGAESLGTGMVLRVVRQADRVYLATAKGLLELMLLSQDTVVAALPVGQDSLFSDLRLDNDTVFYYYAKGMGTVVDGMPRPLVTPGLVGTPVAGANTGDVRWLATESNGIFFRTAAAPTFTSYADIGLPGNDVSDLIVSREGIVTAGFTLNPAASLIDGRWQPIKFWVREGTTYLLDHPDAFPIIGTRGNGLWLWNGDSLANYDENNSSLRGNSDKPPAGLTFVFINGLATDGVYLYAACYRAVNGYPVSIARLDAINDPVRGWDSMGVVDGIITDRVAGLDIHNGELAVGSEASGIFLCDVGSDPFHRPNPACRQMNQANSFLRSNNVRVVKYAPDGTLWAGTNEGLSRYDFGVERFVDVNLPEGIDRTIYDLEFDGRGNLWVGTAGGLARYDANNRRFDIFTTKNSGLVSERIRCITFDSATGITYFGTDAGISWVSSLYGPPETRVENVVAFPNPFLVCSGEDYLSFNFARPGRVSIYNAAGELVREMDVNERWYGRNQAGREVASGVYLFVVTDADGNVGRGKILLVR